MNGTTFGILVDIGTAVGGFITLGLLVRKWLMRELRITRAAVFRLLMSNRRQSRGIVALWQCMNRSENGKACNGPTEEAIDAVKREEDSIAAWVRAVSLGQEPPEEKD